jgi:mxaA protein
VGALLFTALASCWGAAAADGTLNATTSEPRAFGYHVGDLIERDVTVHVPNGLKLDEASMPRPGARGKALELQKVSRRAESESGGMRHELRLTYQVFMSPPEVRTLEIAAFSLHFTGTPRDQDLRVEAWPVTVSPLVPVDPSPREGLGDLRPDRLPPAVDTGPTRWRLIAYGVVLLLLLAYLAQVYVAAPWWARRRRPFALAWQQLRGLPAPIDATASRVAFQRVHDALNQTAGEVLFEHSIDRFLTEQPRYAGLRPELLRFFQQSRREFFGQAAPAANDAQWLVEFCRQCRDVERGAA